MTKRLKVIREQSLHMGIRNELISEMATGPWLLGVLLLFLGLFTVEPALTMAGAVIVVGLIGVVFKCQC